MSKPPKIDNKLGKIACLRVGLVAERCWYNRESRTLLVQQGESNIVGTKDRAISVISCGQFGTVRLKFYCQLPSGEPLDTELCAGKTVSGRQMNMDTDASSRVREWCE
jgi:hypothetical protein